MWAIMAKDGYSTFEVRLRAVRAVRRGTPVGTVAAAFGTNRTTIFRWVRRHRAGGRAGLRRRDGSGRPRKLEEVDGELLWQTVLRPATEFGFETDLWSVGRVHQVIADRFGGQISNDTIWRRLREAGLTWQKPTRRYFEVDEAARQKWLRSEVPRIRAVVRKYRAILYFQDEASLSLTAVLGRTWAPRGRTPTVTVTGKRGAVAVQSAIRRSGHLLFRFHAGRIASGQVIDFLRQMLRHHPNRHLVVVMDQAPPHVSKRTKAFIATQPRLHVFHLPKYSPDWNPDEKVWNHLKNHELKAHRARTKTELRQLAGRKLKRMSRTPSLLRGLFFRCCVADLFG
jgi:transposase